MGLFMGSIKSVAGDCESTHRWALVNLTDDDGNDAKREKLTQCRIVGIGRKYVRLMQANGRKHAVQPSRIQRVW